MFAPYFLALLLFASLLDAEFVVFSPTFQGDWVNGNETSLPNAQACGSVTQTPGSSVSFEPQGVAWFVLYGLFPSDPTTITAELAGVALPLTPIDTANSTGCGNLLYNITLDAASALQNLSARAIPNLTFTFVGPASNNNFFASTCYSVEHKFSFSYSIERKSSLTGLTCNRYTASIFNNGCCNQLDHGKGYQHQLYIASVIPSSTNPALPVIDPHRQSSLFNTRAKLGGGIGGAVGLVALLAAAVAAYLSFKAPVAGASPDYEFEFLAPGAPITVRGKRLQTVQITIVLKVPNLVVTDKIPGAPSTSNEKLTPGRDNVQVAWKVITLSVGKKPTLVRLPKDLGFGGVNDSNGVLDDDLFCFAPPRTLVTKTKYWKHAPLRDRTLAPTVLAKNAAGNPEDFALGSYHVKPSPSFCPLLVIRGVRDGQLCVAPQCEDLCITAYITENIQERQILYDEFYDSGPSRPIVSPDAASAAGEGEDSESDLAPQPIDTEDADEIRKILAPALLGESGKLISDLQQRTRWRLVQERGELKLSVVEQEEV
ncbi:hypothetical protein B0H16DRAFT_1902242 [Mycena metata]|uniref:Uncharacterized protein n=1 Tax=Mycena metata TaxID=1033252 RepID=A0AAD7M6M3_9AGAR|nr:hypothetical protein B0H16DRAFT_1902242 [Mycena metata]